MHRMRSRRSLAAVGAILGLLLAAPSFSDQAFANSAVCPHGGNPQSSACNFIPFTPQNGVATWWKNTAMSANAGWLSAGNHINHTIWGNSCTGSGYTAAWMEVGLTLGYHGDPAYRWYTAYRDTGGFYADFAYTAQSADNSSHLYTVTVGSGLFNSTIDGATLLSVAGIGSHICTGQAGLENNGVPNGNSATLAFGATPLLWQDTGGTWHTSWSGDYWIDYQCGAGYSPPFCFTGGYYRSLGQWISSKPLF